MLAPLMLTSSSKAGCATDCTSKDCTRVFSDQKCFTDILSQISTNTLDYQMAELGLLPKSLCKFYLTLTFMGAVFVC